MLPFYASLEASEKLKDKDKRPSIGGLDFYVAAFYELSTCRQIGMGGVGPIPWTAIAEYSRLMLEPEDFETFHYLMRVLDGIYLEHANKKVASKSEGKK